MKQKITQLAKQTAWTVPYKEIIGLFLLTRLLLISITIMGMILFTPNVPITLEAFLTDWTQWDAAIYARIAQSGYKPPFDMAFSPLFPLLIKINTPSGNGTLTNYTFVGIVISNLALLGTLFILYQLIMETGNTKVARRTLLYLCIFPTAFFFFAAYNEALFLFLSTATFLAIQKKYWWRAGILGALAALTRSVGILLIIPYLMELWLIRDRIYHHKFTIAYRILPVTFICLGSALYCYYCWHLTGNPLEFATVQTHWSRRTTFPWQGLLLAFGELFYNQPFGSFNEVHVLLDLSATTGFIALTVYGYKKIRLSYTLWITLLLLTTLCSSSIEQHDTLISNQRFVLEMFPGFISLAMVSLRHPRLHSLIMWSFPALLAMLSLLFVLGKWMV